MEFIYALAIFILVLILYSQIMFQLKKGDDMEIYELDYTSNKELNESANLKQPFLFLFSNIDTYFKMTPLSTLVQEHGNFDIILKETADYHSNSPTKYSRTPLTLGAASRLCSPTLKASITARTMPTSSWRPVCSNNTSKWTRFSKHPCV